MKYYIFVLVFFVSFTNCDTNTGSNSSNPSSGENVAVLGDKIDKIDIANTNGLQQWTIYKGDDLIEEGEVLNGEKYGNWLELNGKLDGKKIKYSLNKIVMDENYVDGQLNGKRLLYYDDGTIQEEGNFINGKRDGVQRWFDQEGEVKIEFSYKNGEKIEA